MSRLIQWLDHRKEVVGFEKWKDLADYCGLPLQSLRDVRVRQTLNVLNRSERRVFAGALRVSLRKLEQLNDRDIDWIEDTHVFDPDVRGLALPWQEDDPAYWMPKETRPEDRGTPLLGRIKSSGTAEADEDWHEEWGRHLPAIRQGLRHLCSGNRGCWPIHRVPQHSALGISRRTGSGLLLEWMGSAGVVRSGSIDAA